jgi:hypothetical protein
MVTESSVFVAIVRGHLRRSLLETRNAAGTPG